MRLGAYGHPVATADGGDELESRRKDRLDPKLPSGVRRGAYPDLVARLQTDAAVNGGFLPIIGDSSGAKTGWTVRAQ